MQDRGKIPSTLSSFLYDQPLFRADMKDRGVGEDQTQCMQLPSHAGSCNAMFIIVFFAWGQLTCLMGQ